MSDIIPLFTTDYSVGKSILTVSDADEIKDNAPVSITLIAQKYAINPMFVIENNMTGFFKTYKQFAKIGSQFVFGLKLVMVNDMSVKNSDSLEGESRAIILMKDSAGITNLNKIYSRAATEGRYYVPRADWKLLKEFWCDSFVLAMPYYRSFIATNLLYNAQCVPDFPAEPVFFRESHNLPFEDLIDDALLNYCAKNGNKILRAHSIYYFKTEDIHAFQTYKCITNRSSLAVPNSNHFFSESFSFETYLNSIGRTL